MRWQTFAATDRGRVRTQNQDAFLARPDIGLFAVADGMGGHAAGEVASAIAIETIEQMAVHAPQRDATTAADAVRRANEAIMAAVVGAPEHSGMGTTATVLVFRQDTYGIAHVGDSRAYLVRDGTLTRVTVDHTWVQEQVEAGVLSESQARRHPWSSVLTRALGLDVGVEVDVYEGEARPADLFLLCSDGLTAVLTDDDIAATLNAPTSLETRGQALIDDANSRGGPDNITVVLVRVEN